MDVVALGESMVTFLPGRPGRLADVPSFHRAIGGAESNVACALAAHGHTARWVSRVGADGFGDHVVERIAGHGVDVSAVRRDPDRPTGVYFRTAGDRGTDAHEVAYYRAGSAASAMSVENVDMAAARAGRVLHLSGITPALSAECLHLIRELTASGVRGLTGPGVPEAAGPGVPEAAGPGVPEAAGPGVRDLTGPAVRALTAPGPARPLLSFDVNHRPALWPDADTAARVLLSLARRADLVFVGEDEAEQAWGITGGPEAIRKALAEPRVLVVKQGARGATVFEGEAETREPAPVVDVVATTGAGDAFAAGFLSGTLRGLPARDRIRHGHLFAAATLTAPTDLAAPPTRGHADRLTALDDDAWGRLRLGPGWTQTEEAEKEATP
ncbi:sugar kinase [Streptomyces sp. NPDC052301]|uniref:sugar kinase n=1 Tax=Streptomyces sp. NPDC052301 TaxID=3365687 RepID=UPI0037CDA4CF